ncbi:MAG TPA: hypothetical protein VL326_28330 [Kofleriaceae bacterium]|nr:hypothetical protein [Kofleriaceae bacterium]
MKTLLAISLLTALSQVAFAQSADQANDQQPQQQQPAPGPDPYAPPAQPCVAAQTQPPCATPAVAYAEPAPAPAITGQPSAADPAADPDGEDGWHKPVGRRFLHGFRLGWTYLYNVDKMRLDDQGMRTVESLKDKYGIKSPNMMLLGYEGFYRVVGHSWLNVLMVGNVTVAGLEQSKFIPAASGLIGFEFNRSFQLGIGVNLTPDPHAPSHMIAAAGWTPYVGSIQTPIHFFFVPDTDGNHRMGATIGMTY